MTVYLCDQSTSNNSGTAIANNAATAKSQSFTGNGEVIYSAKFLLKKILTPSGSIYARLYAHSGTFGTSSVPTGSALASSAAVDGSTIGTSDFEWVTFTFTDGPILTDGTRYVIAVDVGGTSSAVSSSRWEAAVGTGHGGNYASKTSGTWTVDDDIDTAFEVYTESFAPVGFDLLMPATSYAPVGFDIVGKPWTTIATLAEGATSYDDTTATPGVVYEYRVTALDGTAISGWLRSEAAIIENGTFAVVALATAAAPAGLSITNTVIAQNTYAYPVAAEATADAIAPTVNAEIPAAVAEATAEAPAPSVTGVVTSQLAVVATASATALPPIVTLLTDSYVYAESADAVAMAYPVTYNNGLSYAYAVVALATARAIRPAPFPGQWDQADTGDSAWTGANPASSIWTPVPPSSASWE